MNVGGHSRYKRPESVLVVICTGEGQVLLLRRSGSDGFWQSVTGSLRWDEDDIRATARREVLEETGIADGILFDCRVSNRYAIPPAWRHRYAPGVEENLEHVLRLELAAPAPVRLNALEHEAWVWLPRRAAARQVWSWTNRDAILRWVPAAPEEEGTGR